MQSSDVEVHRYAVAKGALLFAALLCVQGSALVLARGGEAAPDGRVERAGSRETVSPAPAMELPETSEYGSFPAAECNPFVAAWRARLAETPPRLLDAYLSRPDTWRNELTPILEAHDVPAEFLYLALVESGMDAEAVSQARAVGLWQFRDATARQYGLVVEAHLDERVDRIRATSAASRYLRDLFDRFGSWELAAAAYNAGPARVQRALDATGARSYWELQEAGRLPDETRAYVPRFLAVVQLAAERSGARAPEEVGAD